MSLGISDYHKASVVNYLRFARYQRGQRLRSVDACFREVERSHLNDEDATYTHGEVEDLLRDAEAQVRNEVENELINTVHTNVALLVQMFKQAENWRLKLEADVSELENRDLLEKIRNFEESEFHGKSFDDKGAKGSSKKLEPLNEGGAALLKAEIRRLEEENDELRGRLKQIERDSVTRGGDSSLLREENARLRRELDRLGATSSRRDDDDELSSLRGEVSRLNLKARDGTSRNELDSEITALKHELLRVRSTLELAEAELEKKVAETTPFKNIKRMLASKNDQLKDLRRKLSRYEKVDDD